jgi:hypothetical protein
MEKSHKWEIKKELLTYYLGKFVILERKYLTEKMIDRCWNRYIL